VLPEARAVVMAELADAGRSLSQIGALVGGRDASTVSPLVEKGRLLLSERAELRQRVAG
jgi:chromosomal replication initiation ATPase DnaA